MLGHKGGFVNQHIAAAAPSGDWLPVTTGLWSAVSFSKLLSSSPSTCATLRRLADNDEQSYGYTPANLFDDATVNAWAPGGSAVKTWFDQSGNGRDFSQTASVNQQPQYSGLAALFDGLILPYDKLITADPLMNVDLTVFAVIRQTFNNSGVILQHNSGSAFVTFQYGGIDNATDLILYQGNGSGTSFFDGPAMPINTTHYTMLRITAGGGITMTVDQDTPFTGSTARSATFTPAIGGDDYRPMNGKIFELLIYNQALSDADVELVRQNIYTRWGL